MSSGSGGLGDGGWQKHSRDRLFAIHSEFEFKCAFTGADLATETLKDPAGYALFLDHGSGLPGTAITACLDAINAYERGHMAIGARYEFQIALDIINPEFMERLLPIGRLLLPTDPSFYPDPFLLKAHREEFCEGFLRPKP